MEHDSKSDERDDAKLRQLTTQAKQELRARMRAVRRVLPADARAQRSSRAVARIAELPEFERAHTIVAYSALQKELDPAALLTHANALGKRIGLPRVQGDQLYLHVVRPGDPLEEGDFGTLEPRPDAPLIAADEVDFIVVPALALDAEGYRLGYGQAFYDRLLPTLNHAFRVGVVYDFQVLAELPRHPHDVPVQCVVSDGRTLRM